MCYPTSRQLLAIKGAQNRLKDFVATFLPANFGSKSRLPENGDSNVSCCALAIIYAFRNPAIVR